MMKGGAGRRGSSRLAERLDRLTRAVSPPGREYSYREISRMIEARSGEAISASYIHQLRTGVKDNPTMRHLELLADFFGVPVAYFFEDETARAVDAELELLTAMRSAGVRDIALRSVGLSPEGLRLVADVVERLRTLNGMDRVDEPGAAGKGHRPRTTGGRVADDSVEPGEQRQKG